ncbi:hypothetical protein L1987_00727 [Smallanthus sonchifolius]|uniref:Uncharacterized protein n=1 Tax=Smallanthus sonchifolius TaxID=185202 RepID=A0ACB9K396_9ASTR|nr:hypothetical protein L1987_00727 [Smallanthus sonchifolius]
MASMNRPSIGSGRDMIEMVTGCPENGIQILLGPRPFIMDLTGTASGHRIRIDINRLLCMRQNSGGHREVSVVIALVKVVCKVKPEGLMLTNNNFDKA